MAVGSEIPSHKLGERRSRWWWLLVFSPIICLAAGITLGFGSAWIGIASLSGLVVVLVALHRVLSKVAGSLDPFR